MDETERRRQIQEEYNLIHGITPTTIQKAVVDLIERQQDPELTLENKREQLFSEYDPKKFKSKHKWKQTVEKDMLKAAEKLDFEKAALLRDLIYPAD